MREGISEAQAIECLVREAFADALISKRAAGLRRSVEMGVLYARMNAARGADYVVASYNTAQKYAKVVADVGEQLPRPSAKGTCSA